MKKLLIRRRTPVSILVVFTVAVILFVNACGFGTGSSTKAGALDAEDPSLNENEAGGEPVTISLWFPWGGGFKKEFDDTVVKPFEAANPDIKVQLTFVENSDNSQASDKLLTAIAGGRAPDVAMLDRFVVGEWAAMDALEDLSERAKQDQIAGMYYPAMWAEAQYDGRTYALPWNTDSRAMFYNKTMMKEAGLDPDKPPATISELDGMAEKMFRTNGKGDYDQVGMIPWLGQGFLYTHGWNFGGEWEKNGALTPNDPAIVNALRWMQYYAKKYGTKKLFSFTNALKQTGRNPFLSGKVGFIYEGNWLLNEIGDSSFDWGVAPMPTVDSSLDETWAGGWSFVMPKGARHQEQAWRFITFITGKEGALLWASRAGSKFDITSIPEVNAQLGLDHKENLSVFVNLLAHAHIRPVTPVGGYMWDEMYRVQNLAVQLQGEPQALLNQMKKKVDAELARVKAGVFGETSK
ncbi:ABC transporter substrate-binding protein [Paenibacillus sp. R14(2021)]|uniref:ABC transporter substrate-binding protein n=1 Tax=Paenibacillus sp. R14(2021) TaxID=2859228 RepID=UPI001C614386|nr:ABC transporter substrate-binding protein [Paenibacillus sp. R14(2021)]